MHEVACIYKLGFMLGCYRKTVKGAVTKPVKKGPQAEDNQVMSDLCEDCGRWLWLEETLFGTIGEAAGKAV